ncbi:MAG: hypothetical protein F4068_10485, partial [Gemmatimonadetes bacterium]|nr:hypothetical protein [Gemmatimonadota bacterium]
GARQGGGAGGRDRRPRRRRVRAGRTRGDQPRDLRPDLRGAAGRRTAFVGGGDPGGGPGTRPGRDGSERGGSAGLRRGARRRRALHGSRVDGRAKPFGGAEQPARHDRVGRHPPGGYQCGWGCVSRARR